MNALELKDVLLSLVQQIEDLRVNQAALAEMTKPGHTLGAVLDVRSTAERKTKQEFSALRKQIEGLA